MPAPANLVHQTSTSTGTGNLTVATVNGKQSFSTAFGTGVTTDVFDYFISHQSAAEWERGTGHMSDATTLVRDTVIESTNANAAVNFSAGTKDIVNDIPALSQTRGPTAFTDNAIVRGDTSASGSLVQDSGVTISDTNNVNIPGTLTVSGATVLGSTLTVSGATTINNTLAAGATTVNGTLGVSGAATLLSTLSVCGQANFNAAQPSATFADAAGRLSAMRVYTTTGNVWSKPAGLSFIIVECVGAGGGGSGSTTTNVQGGGGGAGGYCRKKIAAASLGATENVTVGTGGSAGATGAGAGGAGGSTSFGTTPFCTACGGGPGTTGGGFLAGCGGLATSGDINTKGGGGFSGIHIGPTGNAGGVQVFGVAGGGGNSFFGAGARNETGGTGTIITGLCGGPYGGGGAGGACVGAVSGGAGGSGGNGVCIVWEYI